jgi:hypothetical protein
MTDKRIPLDAQQIIKAAVQAIEDVVEENVRPRKNNRYRCDHDRWDFEHCDDCIREHLIPHLQAMKGLIDDGILQRKQPARGGHAAPAD